MKYLKYLLLAITSFLMIYGSYNHVANPAFYNGFIPDFLPKLAVNYFSAVVELIVGILLIIPKTRAKGFLSFSILMVAFLPIHIWDLFKEVPAIGSQNAAIIRLIVQFIFIALTYLAYKAESKKSLEII